ncbi:MAG: peptide ABC transporter substrate-binding protein [Enterococcus italicus]|jgi:oligopeptide transport system substrate-binding protein|uniref:peptide ABC transporter substrate-binding protein n=1 Tax=Enterococcus italicus TaxID=246144 RepID=UPI002072FEE5|nr:peptide ABC transporter substrate-binding protein [Enterococcus italicus]
MKKGSMSRIGFSILGLALLGGCYNNQSSTGTSTSSETKQEFTQLIGSELATADTSLATDTLSFYMINNYDEGLYRLDEDNQAVPAGAESLADVSADGKTYTVKLRQDATWSNGDKVTAKDYVYGWQRTVDPKTASQYAFMFSNVVNADDIADGKKDVSELGIKAVDDYTLEITLNKATPYFSSLLAFPSFFPQNQKYIEEQGTNYASTSDHLIFNGPFKLEGYDGPGIDTEWKLVKNDTYWDKKNVKLSTINFSVVKETSTAYNMFEDGQAQDISLTGELAKQKADDKEYVAEPLAATFYVEFNQAASDSPYRNANLRKAISYAIDRASLVDNILGNGSVVSTGLVPSGMSYNSETKADFTKDANLSLDYDQAKAKEYWEKAKSELGITSLSFDFLSSDTDATKQVTQYLKAQIEDTLSGVTVNLTPVPGTVRLDRVNSGDFQVALNNWVADYNDPSTFLDLFLEDSSYNRGKWINADYNKAVTAAANEDANDETKRWQDMIDADTILNDDMGIVPLYQPKEAHLRSSSLKGIVSHPAGAQYDFKWAYIK